MPALPEPIRRRIAAAVAEWPGGAGTSMFVEAVVEQRAQPLGEVPGGDSEGAQRRVTIQVLRLIEYAIAGDAGVARAAAELADDVALLAAFFQNLDLLPPGPDPSADAVALVVGAAVQRLADMTDPGPDAI